MPTLKWSASFGLPSWNYTGSSLEHSLHRHMLYLSEFDWGCDFVAGDVTITSVEYDMYLDILINLMHLVALFTAVVHTI